MEDRGQALPLVVAAVAATAMVVVAAGSLGARLVHYQHARNGADAAALAALVGGTAEAERLCRRHGCTVVEVLLVADTATVSVRVGTVTSSATATWSTSP